MTTKTAKTTKATKAPAKPVINQDAWAIVTAVLMNKGTNITTAMEQAKYIMEKANEYVG